VASACFSLAASTLSAEPTLDWRTGVELLRQLETPVGFRWEQNPLRTGLRNLSRHQQVALWLDRRVDPDQKTDLSIDSLPLTSALERVASSFGGGVCRVGPVIYLGPPNVASKLATLAALKRDETKALPPAVRGRLERAQAWRWEDLTSPQELLEQLSQTNNFQLVNAEQIPHDLWAAGDFPAMPVTDRLTLLLAGFNLTFDIARDGSAIRPTPIPESVALERTYSIRGAATDILARLTSDFPQTSLRRTGNQVTVSGSYEDHEQIARLLRGESLRKQDRGVGEKRFDLRFTNQPVAAAIHLLAEREGFSVQIDPALEARLQQRLSLDLKQATLHELLEKVLQPVGMTYRLQGKSLELQAAP